MTFLQESSNMLQSHYSPYHNPTLEGCRVSVSALDSEQYQIQLIFGNRPEEVYYKTWQDFQNLSRLMEELQVENIPEFPNKKGFLSFLFNHLLQLQQYLQHLISLPKTHHILRRYFFQNQNENGLQYLANVALGIEQQQQQQLQQNRKTYLEDYELIKVLGKGCMGKVLLAKEKISNKIYAIKSISKSWVVSHGQQEIEHTKSEQRILASLSQIKHPFLIKLHCSFQSKQNLFLVLEYIGGGDLATQLALFGRFEMERCRFYTAEILEGVLELHRLGICYRDLKPENVLLHYDGHIKLTDFGLSKQLKLSHKWTHMDVHTEDCSCQKTKTFCGTAEYLAPEVLLEQPYDFSVDFWSLGTFLYEMITGITPFWAENHLEMYRRVLEDALRFPNDFTDEAAKDLIRLLLIRDPKLRKQSTLNIKQHPFFHSIDFQALLEKRVHAPYVPNVKDESDVRWFDETFTNMTPRISNPITTTHPQNQSLKEERGSLFSGYTFISHSYVHKWQHQQQSPNVKRFKSQSPVKKSVGVYEMGGLVEEEEEEVFMNFEGEELEFEMEDV